MTFAFLNANRFKKVAIVKEYLAHIVDYIDFTKCNDIRLLG